ncbi:MAG: hypothetical protein QOI66_3850 [Myxococcales bacterium]|jgi:hypothetical protein|nr:hypothetical protein [Myxococcales bacterium]
MKTLTTGVLTVCLLAAAGCKTQTLVGRERPPSDGGSGGMPNSNEDASSPSPDVGNPPGNREDAAASGDGESDSDGDGREASPPPDPNPPFTIPDAYVGEWTGYFQAFTLRSGSDAIALNLIRTPGAPDRITVVLGVGTPPVLTGPDPVWPTTNAVRTADNFPAYYEGMVYDGHEVKWRDNRLTFAISANDAFRFWCPMQKSLLESDGAAYSCASYMIFLSDNGCTSAGVPISCAQWNACREGFCACDAKGCQAHYHPSILFDITFEPPPVIGAASLGSTFRITRKPTDGGVTESGQ